MPEQDSGMSPIRVVANTIYIHPSSLAKSMTDIDLDSYGDPNDIGPDDPAPREPEGRPDVTTEEFQVWLFESEQSATVQDCYVVDRNPLPLDFRMWVFVGRGERAHFVMRASHRYGETEVVAGDRSDCCEVLYEGGSLRESHCPANVESTVEELANAPVSFPDEPEEDTHGGPVSY